MAGSLRITQSAQPGRGEDGSYTGGVANRQAIQVVQDWYTYQALIGASFQIRAGTITTPLVGDVVLTDAAAEYCVDAPSGTTVIPVYNNIGVRSGPGTLHEFAIKSVGTSSSAGAAFTPLPLRMAGPGGVAAIASVATARVTAAGGVTVTAELATTTRRHWSWANPTVAGAGNPLPAAFEWTPRMPPIIVGGSLGSCLYVQIAATGTGPAYYANLDFIEVPTATIL